MHPETTNIPLTMLAVFGSAKLLAEIFERLKQPAIVGEILAGVLIGPAVLGWIHPSPALSALADLGLLFLLFRVGMEVRSSELLSVGGTAAIVALLGVIAPFFLGWGVMALAGTSHLESIFVAAAMVATSVGITAKVLGERGLLAHRSSQIILAAAVIDDVLGLVVLALVTSLTREHVRILELLAIAAIALGFTFIIATWGKRTVDRVAPPVVSRLRAGEVQFNVSVLLMFALSAAALYAGIAAIVGAFLAGMALSDHATDRVRDLTQGVSELLVPFFLVGIGLNLDTTVFAHFSTVALCLAILAAAVVSKLIGCGVGAMGMGRRAMLQVGVGMIPRGEVGMIIAQIGMSLGVITRQTYGVVVFMAVATTLIAPPLLGMAFRKRVIESQDESNH